jgi:alpha-aminoadipic semialdehyde synthase
VRELRERFGLETLVQPYPIRIFSDEDYRLQGARVEEDISSAPVIFALKEIPPSLVAKDKVYAFFSHTAKGQPHNLAMLRRMMELGSTIIDYELVTDDNGRRLLSFGNYAGQAGMVDTLWALGRRLLAEGMKTPFADLQPTPRYLSLVDAREAVARVGWKVEHRGLPEGLAPLVVGFLGYGRASRGAQEIFDLLPGEDVAPAEISRLRDQRYSAHRIYKAVFKEEDMVKPRGGGRAFDLQDYYRNPGDYEPVVEDVVTHLTVLVNGAFWTRASAL